MLPATYFYCYTFEKMTEFIIQHPFRSGHVIDIHTTTLDLYRLLSSFYSSRKFAELNTSLHDDPVNYLLQFEEFEITRILTSTAITARIIDDREERYLNDYDTTCGQLIKNLENIEEVVELTLREACNKIIHANRVHYDVSECNGNKYLNPKMFYYGKLNGKEWKAILDIERYVFNFISFVATQTP